MLTISKPLSAGQATRYHAEEFQNARENYYAESDRIVGVWHGRLADRWGLFGDVDEQQFQRLADGRHPLTGEQLVRHQTPRRTTNARGETISTMEHRRQRHVRRFRWHVRPIHGSTRGSLMPVVSMTAGFFTPSLIGYEPFFRARDALRINLRVSLEDKDDSPD